MPHEPERSDVFGAEPVVDEIDDVSQVRVVVVRIPQAVDSTGCGHDEAILLLQIHEREVVPVPVAVHRSTVKAQDEGHPFAGIQVTRIIEEEAALGLLRDRSIPRVGD
jgi:hypothetical protein